MAWSVLDKEWHHLLVRGGVAVVFGVVAMAYPLSTAVVLALLWGLWALADGVLNLVQASRPGPRAARLVLAVMGVLALLVGVVAVASPGVTAVTLTWVLGLWLLARGVLDAVTATLGRGVEARLGLLASGALDVLLGLLFVLNPGRSVVTLAFVLGLTAAVWGLVLVGAAVAVRRHDRDAGAAPGPVVA
ncbi:DUF308 domain-containing protein [Nocardioides sp. TF02-7]|uniref:HdeD family acid-resistance protein n=1 Tax=Nocardioides sp. TF02-7 TaxID=2917724 RepID=UPI001F056A4E|nr:DUF308 domain-containing protein [Nocardioides sp. TF02-7]UMG91515.1 DUF308 domain-containing protein [Nocardioides sp. TF02-7]